tara:strand:- start:324 stop:476 length:153 start_codon:yes stop_codon:yes gene_type:complete
LATRRSTTELHPLKKISVCAEISIDFLVILCIMNGVAVWGEAPGTWSPLM